MLVEAAPLVPDKTICNPINDLKRGGVALIDTSLSFVVSDMLNPPQQSTLNGALTQVGFIQRERKGRICQQRSHEPGPIVTLNTQTTAAEVSCFLQTTVKKM